MPMNFSLQSILNYVVLLTCLAITILLSVFVIWPQYSSYRASLPILSLKQSQNDQLDAFVKYLQNLSDFQEKLFANMGLSKQAIPDTEEAPFFLDQIIQISEVSNVSINSLTFGGLSGRSTSPAKSAEGNFIRFQAEPGENLDNISATEQVDELIPGASTDTIPVALPITLPPQEFYVRLTFLGNYETTTDFLVKLETARRLSDILEIEVELKDIKLGDEQQLAATQAYLATLGGADGISGSQTLYESTLLISGFYMKDPEIGAIGPDLLNRQPNLELAVKDIEALTYYEPKSIEEIELNIGRLNPFDEQEGIEVEAQVTNTGNITETNSEANEDVAAAPANENVTTTTNDIVIEESEATPE